MATITALLSIGQAEGSRISGKQHDLPAKAALYQW